MAASKQNKKQGRRWWWWPFGFALFAVAGLSLLRWLVQPERLGALLLDQAERASGLQFEVATPPRLGIWPRLHLQLGGLVVRDPAMPDIELARAAHVALYLPLSVLRGETRIDAIAIQAPRLDLADLERWSAAQMGPPSAPWLPPVSLLEIRAGSLQGSSWTLADIDLDLRHLLQTEPLNIELDAELVPEQGASLPLSLQLRADNPPSNTTLQWTVQSLTLGDPQRSWLERMQGHIALPAWSAPKISLSGIANDWPAGWPPLPEALAANLQGLRLDVQFDAQDPITALRIEADGEGRKARVGMQPASLASWLDQGDWLAPLPTSIELSVESIEIDGVRIEGLELRNGVDAPH